MMVFIFLPKITAYGVVPFNFSDLVHDFRSTLAASLFREFLDSKNALFCKMIN